MSVLSVVTLMSDMRGLDLITQFLILVNRTNQNTALGGMGLVSVVSVQSVIRGLYLTTQSSNTTN